MRISSSIDRNKRTSKTNGSPARRTGRRRATAAVEFIMVLPVLVTALLGTIEFSMLLTARGQLLAAAEAGARVAAQGGTQTDIETAVFAVLQYSTTVSVATTTA